MHSQGCWKRPAGPAGSSKWRRRLPVYGVTLVLFALAAGVAISERAHREATAAQRGEPAAIAGMADGQSAGGNLVPLY